MNSTYGIHDTSGIRVTNLVQTNHLNIIPVVLPSSEKPAAGVMQQNMGSSLEIVTRGNLSNAFSYKDFYFSAPWSDFLSVHNFLFKSQLNNAKTVFYYSEKDSSSQNVISQNFNSQIHNNLSNIAFGNFILTFLLLSFILLAWIKVSFGKYLNQLLKAIIYYSESAKLYHDHNSLIERLYFVLNVIFIISGGFFSFYLIQYFKPSFIFFHPILVVLICYGSIILIYLSRFIVNKILGFLFDHGKSFNEHIHSTFIYYKAAGLFLLPIVSIIPYISDSYGHILLIIGVLIIFILYIISIFRATRIMLQKDILLFYWILYLCTIEFLPIMLIYKFINSIA
jgi:hypothetical protein